MIGIVNLEQSNYLEAFDSIFQIGYHLSRNEVK